MTPQTKKQEIEKKLRELELVPKGAGSVTFHFAPDNKITKYEIKIVE